MADGEKRARVLLLGGTGFIGRHLVNYFVNNDLVSKIRVADKVPPQMAWMSTKHKDAFASPVVEFKHSNLINPASVKNAFTDPDGGFDYVINLAAETKYGQSDPVYQEGIVRLSMNCATEAASRNVKLYIEISSGQMYSSDKKPCREDGKCDPWTKMAQHKHQVEERLKNLQTELNYVIIRPAIVYGVGDKVGLTPRLIIGAIYKYIRQKMKLLWTKDLKMNTVHVEDFCRAVWHLCEKGKHHEVYNIVDLGDTTQGKLCQLVSEVFDIQYAFAGSVVSNLARVNMTNVVEDINDKHMQPWSEACLNDQIMNTPLNPFIDEELLYNKHIYLDNSKLLDSGFTFTYPTLTREALDEVLKDYVQLKLFPASLLSDEALWSGKDKYTEAENEAEFELFGEESTENDNH